MLCPSCGNETPKGHFCGYCGFELRETHTREIPAESPAEETIKGEEIPGKKEPHTGIIPGQTSREEKTRLIEREIKPEQGEISSMKIKPRENTGEKAPTEKEGEEPAFLREKIERITRLKEKELKTPTEKLPASFGRYRVIRVLGRGAMGIVYLARDDVIGREVAIKTLYIDPALSQEEQKESEERFSREAHAAGSLSHPNIVVIHDVGKEGKIPYIAMEYLKGATLSEILSEGPLPVSQCVNIITQVLSALAYAH